MSEHQVWSRVRRIGQNEEQHTQRLINLETIDLLIEEAQRQRESPMLYAYGIMGQLDENVDTDKVFDALVGSISPAVLMDQVIGHGGRVEVEIDSD